MLTKDFYKVIDAELNVLLEKYKEDKFLKKLHQASSMNNRKSYSLLIWFLDFYGRKSNYTDFITDGDNDSSCDIVFDNMDNQGNRVFYVVQSKWNTIENSEKETNKDEILKALSDFETILRGEKQKINDKLRIKLEELYKHLQSNGEVKFIFLSLSQYKGNAEENINAFRNSDEKIKFEVIDIQRIRMDYIDRKYKNIEPLNPLENYQNPEESPVKIEIIQKNGNIKIEKPFEAYLFLMRPKSLYDLFHKYGFALFYKNVRNPLLQSQFNEEMEKTALENPAYFWYYNNGITAITYMLPSIGKRADTIQLTGLQIINGAQTVYSIYRAYKTASPTKRIQMDNEALVTFRLLKSGGQDFDLNVTRFTNFTNSQNSVSDRDLCAHNAIQIELQTASYQTKIWYEKRRGEFRILPDDVQKIPNFIFANVYLAYYLQDPISVLKNHQQQIKSNKDLNFISHRNHKQGFYEKIFNQNTRFEDMLAAFYLYHLMVEQMKLPYEQTFKTNIYYLLSLFKIVFTKYLKAKFDPTIHVNKHILKIYEKNERTLFLKTFQFILDFVAKQTGVMILLESNYEKIKYLLDDLEIAPSEIEGIVLKKGENSLEIK
jgi:hypothetical protein